MGVWRCRSNLAMIGSIHSGRVLALEVDPAGRADSASAVVAGASPVTKKGLGWWPIDINFGFQKRFPAAREEIMNMRSATKRSDTSSDFARRNWDHSTFPQLAARGTA